MILRNIVSILNNYGYNLMRNTNPQYLFFSKLGSETFSSIVLIDDIKRATPTDAHVLSSIKESLESTLLLRGYKQVDVLFIIFSNSPFSYKELAENDFFFWIADVNANRIISYTADDGEFSSMRDSIEGALSDNSKKAFSLRSATLGEAKKPIFTIAFAIINALIFLYMDLFCDVVQSTLLYLRFSSEYISVLDGNQFYRLFTSMFLHFDINHLSSNMISLIAVGLLLEPSMGHIRFSLTYILSGLSGSVASVFYHQYLGESVLSAGALGAIFGIFGAYAVCALFDKLRGKPVPAMKIGMVSILMLINGMTSGSVDNAAHLGGIVAGCLISFICCICNKNKI